MHPPCDFPKEGNLCTELLNWGEGCGRHGPWKTNKLVITRNRGKNVLKAVCERSRGMLYLRGLRPGHGHLLAARRWPPTPNPANNARGCWGAQCEDPGRPGQMLDECRYFSLVTEKWPRVRLIVWTGDTSLPFRVVREFPFESMKMKAPSGAEGALCSSETTTVRGRSYTFPWQSVPAPVTLPRHPAGWGSWGQPQMGAGALETRSRRQLCPYPALGAGGRVAAREAACALLRRRGPGDAAAQRRL